MVWMETFLFCFSVRFGVILIASSTLIHFVVLIVIQAWFKNDLVNPFLQLYLDDESFKGSYVVMSIFEDLKASKKEYIVLLNLYYVIHIIAGISAVYGALKLRKLFLVPFIVCELLRVIYSLTIHITLMIVLKKMISLGLLIAFTLIGSFVNLFVGYGWATCIALYQIIYLIHTKHYQSLYGNDPFNPNSQMRSNRNAFANDNVENIHVLVTPNANDIDEQKRKNKLNENHIKTSSIITVKPLKKLNGEPFNRFSYQKIHSQQNEEKNFNQEYYYNDPIIDYNNWQWAEIAINRRKQNHIIGKPKLRY